MPPSARLRSVVVLVAGAYVVHTLRYVLAYGGAAPGELVEQGHGYLAAAPVVLTVLLAATAAALVLRVARGRGPGGHEGSLRSVWAVATAALLAIFVAQELAEGWLSAGHPAGVAALSAHGGWLAAPLAAAAGLLVALLHRGAAAVLAAARRRAPRPTARPVAALLVGRPSRAHVSRVPGPWLGGRGPPALAG